MAWTTPRTWTATEVVTAAMLNQHVRDNLNAIGSHLWQAYTPTLAGGDSSIGTGAITGRYMQAGELIVFEVSLVSAAGTNLGTTETTLTLPVAASRTGLTFAGRLADASVPAYYPIVGINQAASVLTLYQWPSTAGAAFAGVTHTSPFSWTVSDSIIISGAYEVA